MGCLRCLVSNFAVRKRKKKNYTLASEVRVMFNQYLCSALKKKKQLHPNLGGVSTMFSQYPPAHLYILYWFAACHTIYV